VPEPETALFQAPETLGGGVILAGGEATAALGLATIEGRHIFYNDSEFDGDNPAANSDDDDAIAPPPHMELPETPHDELGKTALLPGQTATFANYTSYSRGINGIMVDIAGLNPEGTISADDFEFRVGNDSTPSGWSTAPAPTSVTVRTGAGEGGSDRITIIWADNAIAKEWLQVRVLANDDTWLLHDDLFYFGNAIGEAGNSASDAKVNKIDVQLARNNPRTFLNPAPIEFPYDYNRDARVNTTDMLIARDNPTSFIDDLNLITVPKRFEVTSFTTAFNDVQTPEDPMSYDEFNFSYTIYDIQFNDTQGAPDP
jgi:hypothetical protein